MIRRIKDGFFIILLISNINSVIYIVICKLSLISKHFFQYILFNLAFFKFLRASAIRIWHPSPLYGRPLRMAPNVRDDKKAVTKFVTTLEKEIDEKMLNDPLVKLMTQRFVVFKWDGLRELLICQEDTGNFDVLQNYLQIMKEQLKFKKMLKEISWSDLWCSLWCSLWC